MKSKTHMMGKIAQGMGGVRKPMPGKKLPNKRKKFADALRGAFDAKS